MGQHSGHVHMVGAAGVGMSALAQAARHAGYSVTGSDRYFDAGRELDVISKLGGCGIRFVRQDGGGVTAETVAVVYSTAIEDDNPDVQAAKRLGVPLVHRAAMLTRLLEGREAVAVTGTCGKSTVTGMLGWILECCGRDPVVVNGAPVLNWADAAHVGNARLGRGNLWVFEADESDKSLVSYHPDWAVITNVSKDHFDTATAVELFRRFACQVKRGAVNVLEEPELMRDFRPAAADRGTSFAYRGVSFLVPLPGAHNAENAYLAVLMAEQLGCGLEEVRAALGSFRGIQRRLETVGHARGVTVVDDYAHNPVKIGAAWNALAAGGRRVIGIWRPHGYGPLRLMLDELASSFAHVCGAKDELLLLPVFDAGGTADRSTRSEQLAERLQAAGKACRVVADYDEAVRHVKASARQGDVVVTMGARDPGLPELARAILRALA